MLARGARSCPMASTVLGARESGYEALPGPAELKLWPDAIARLGESPDRFPIVDPGWEKTLVSRPRKARQGPMELGRVLVLADGDEERIETLSPSAQAFELVRNAYLAEYVTPSSQPLLLAEMAGLASRVPVKSLRRRRGPSTSRPCSRRYSRRLAL